MTYAGRSSGRVEAHPSGCGRDHLGAGFMTFEDVEGRMVEAMLLWRRAPDRERGWLHVRAFWPEIRRFGWTTSVGGEYDHPEEQPQPRALPLTRAEVASMMEASDWLAHAPQADRKLVALALTALAAGHKRVPWARLKPLMGVEYGAHGLRKRYCRAIATIAKAVNAQKSANGDGQAAL
jgi:hypothetical protein